MERLFVIVRADLPPGAQLAQAVHTAREFAAAHGELDRLWHEGSKNLVALQVPDEPALHALRARADAAGVPLAVNHEPDLGDALTGIALADTGARLVSSLPLALRAPRQPRVRQPLASAPAPSDA